MAAKRIRSRISTACLATLLLSPIGLVLAQSPIEPKAKPEGTVAIAALPSASSHQSDATSELWFRVSVDFVPGGGFSPLRATNDAPASEQPATAQLAPAEVKVPAAVQVPGQVKNLRRADKQ
jgi:hypothetical protein